MTARVVSNERVGAKHNAHTQRVDRLSWGAWPRIGARLALAALAVLLLLVISPVALVLYATVFFWERRP